MTYVFDLIAYNNYLYTGIGNKIIRIDIISGETEVWLTTEEFGQILGLTIYNNDLYIINTLIGEGDIYSRISKINLNGSSLILDWYTSNLMVSMRENNNMLYNINYNPTTSTSTITRHNFVDQIEDWITIDIPFAISLTFHNNIMYISNFFSISKININSKQVTNNWVTIPISNEEIFFPFLMLTNFTIDGITNLYASSIVTNRIYSFLIS